MCATLFVLVGTVHKTSAKTEVCYTKFKRTKIYFVVQMTNYTKISRYMVIVEAPCVQSLIGCQTSDATCSSHLLATHRITKACVLGCSFATLRAAHGLLLQLTSIN